MRWIMILIKRAKIKQTGLAKIMESRFYGRSFLFYIISDKQFAVSVDNLGALFEWQPLFREKTSLIRI